MSDPIFAEWESRDPEKILKERMRIVLRDQISMNASPLQRNGEHIEIVSAVVISIPEMASSRTTSWRERWATIMWSEVPVTGSLDPSIFEEHEKEIRIPISVKRSGPALISCTVFDSEWDSTQLLLNLFIRGYGKAVFDGESGERMKVAHAVNIVGMHEYSHKSIKANSESSSLLERTWRRIFGLSSQKHRQAVPAGNIFYRFFFPTFHRSEANRISNTSPYEDVITIFVKTPQAGCEQMFVKIPVSVRDLQGCTIELQHYYIDLDLDELVAGLLELGCCTEEFHLKLASFKPPWTLPDSSTVTMFSYAGEPEGSRRHALIYYQIQLMLQEQQNQNRLLMARQNLVNVESNSTFGSPMSWGQSIAQSPMSMFGSPMSFMTASSPASFMTARSAYTSPILATMNGVSPITRIETIREDEPPEPSMAPPLRKLRNDYYEHLHQQSIIQPFDKELVR
jgi:hypothetical protein